MRNYARVAAASIVLALSVSAAVQTAQAVVAGRVLDAGTGAPVPNARITTTVTAVGAPVVLSDRDGRFSLLLPAGPHGIGVTKTGYAKQSVMAIAGDEPVEIRLQRGGAISGRIADEFGDPGIGFRVRVDTRGDGGARSTVAETQTDDHGEYRIGGLGADTFFVYFVPNVSILSISIGGPRTVVGDGGLTDPLFYPAAGSIDDAQAIVLRPGEERAGIDFLVPNAGSMADLDAAANQPGALPIPSVRPTSGLGGRVTDGAGRGLARAQLRLTCTSTGPSRQVFTTQADKDGRFAFRDLPAGTCRLSTRKIGYFSNPLPNPNVPLPPSFELKDGETRNDLAIQLDQWGRIEGRVVDEHGDPMAGAVVQLLHIKYEAGRRSLVRVDIRDPRTDDRGRFRVYAIPPGQYIVSALVNDVSSAELPGYARGYYPGTMDPAGAVFIPVAAGAEIAGIDVALARTRTARISGQLLDVDGQLTMGGSVLLVPSRSSAYGEAAGARIGRTGAFEFLNVVPGQYVIQVYRGRVNGFTEGDFAAVPVTVGNDDVTGLVVRATPAASVTGRITFNTGQPLKTPAAGTMDIYAMPTDPLRAPLNGLATANIRPDWTFELAGITGTRRLQMGRVPPGWAVEAIRVEGVDITDRPIAFGGAERSLRDVEIVLTDRIAILTGTVSDDRARLVPGACVVVYSTDADSWYPASRFVRKTTTDANGAFTVSGLPSGTYNVAAVSALPADGPDAWQDPEYLGAMAARAQKQSIVEGLPATTRLQVAR